MTDSSSQHSSHLEWFNAACDICTITVCLLQSLQHVPLQAWLPLTVDPLLSPSDMSIIFVTYLLQKLKQILVNKLYA